MLQKNNLKKSLKNLVCGLRTVFFQWRYVATASVAGLLFFAFVVSLPNARFAMQMLGNTSVPFFSRLSIIWVVLSSLQSNFTIFSLLYASLIAILFGMNISLIAYVITQRKAALRNAETTASFFGMVSGMLGAGCAACGSFLINSVLSLVGATGLITFLPLKGQEFAFLSIALLGVSLYQGCVKIAAPAICKTTYQL